jgi:hypothetical protein
VTTPRTTVATTAPTTVAPTPTTQPRKGHGDDHGKPKPPGPGDG